ncbi:MAG: MotA/TolQ/ExbB proton channel family protein [Sphingomonadales bacterium]|nr:MotA/TolQ/ExbB proton channel family protein [Sphingomonadales bacterium]
MKKLAFYTLCLMTFALLGARMDAAAQGKQAQPATEKAGDTTAKSADTSAAASTDTAAAADETAAAVNEGQDSIHYVFKQKFIEGDVVWMAPVLLCLILGLAVVIERVIYLNLATNNNRKLLGNVESALKSGGVDAAKEVCRNTRGPVASIFYQGLDRAEEGVEIAEKAVSAYGSVQMGQLERGLIWVSLFIALAPMLGFLGTVVGMIQAFDAIEIAGDISPSLVAGGIKVALLTTVFGLIVAIILQIFYNYLISKVDSLVNAMEDASIGLIDLLVKHSKK